MQFKIEEMHGTGDLPMHVLVLVQARGDVDGYEIRIRGENSADTTEDGWLKTVASKSS